MLKVYLAAAWSRRDEVERFSRWLTSPAFFTKVTSRWHHADQHRIMEAGTGAEKRQHNERIALEDLEDIRNADVMVAFTEGGTRGGRHVELGYALALQKRIILVGKRENVFHYLKQIRRCVNTDTALLLVTKWALLEEGKPRRSSA